MKNIYLFKLLNYNFFIKKPNLIFFFFLWNLVNKKTQLIGSSYSVTKTHTTQYNLKFLFFLQHLKITVKTPYSTFFWFSKYLAHYLKTYTNVLIYWQFINLNLNTHNTAILNLWRLTYKKYILQNFYCSAWFYFYLIIQLYFFKNVDHLCTFFSKIIQNTSLKQHKQLFDIVGELFESYLTILYNTKKLKGYRVYFKGKLGKKGSVKKSIVYFTGGLRSYTTKSLRYNYKYFTVPTETGVVGCYISLFYNTNVYIYIFILNYLSHNLYILNDIFMFSVSNYQPRTILFDLFINCL